MNLKIIKPHQFSLERSHAVVTELKNNGLWTKACVYLDKNNSLGHLDKKISKTKMMKLF